MSTPTEVHLDLALQIAEALARSGNVAAAKLIADSEARAVASAVTTLTCTHHNDQMRATCPVCLVAELTAEREKAERYRLVTLHRDAELAAERARLDAGTILLIVAGERVWHCGVDLRAAIDAAMKEGAK